MKAFLGRLCLPLLNTPWHHSIEPGRFDAFCIELLQPMVCQQFCIVNPSTIHSIYRDSPKAAFSFPQHGCLPLAGYGPDSDILPYHYQPILFDLEYYIIRSPVDSLCIIYSHTGSLRLIVCVFSLLLRKTEVIFSLVVTIRLCFGKWVENTYLTRMQPLLLLSLKQSSSYTCLSSICLLMTMAA